MNVQSAGTRTVTGYLSGYSNPQFSGLANIVVRTRLKATKARPGTHYLGSIESGHGTRVLIDALDCGRVLTQESGRVKLRWTFDAGLCVSVGRIGGETYAYEDE